MRTSTRACLAALLASIAACGPSAPPAAEGVGPSSSARAQSTESRPKVELARPEPAPTVVVAPTPEPVPEPVAPKPSVMGPDISDLGPFEVIGWDEARQRAEQRITAENLDAELSKVRGEIESRP